MHSASDIQGQYGTVIQDIAQLKCAVDWMTEKDYIRRWKLHAPHTDCTVLWWPTVGYMADLWGKEQKAARRTKYYEESL